MEVRREVWEVGEGGTLVSRTRERAGGDGGGFGPSWVGGLWEVSVPGQG